MRLEDQASGPLLARPVDADDDRRFRMLVRHFEPPGWRSMPCTVHGETLHRVAAVPKGAEDEILDRVLLAACRRKADELCV
jgi:hypothetical protein